MGFRITTGMMMNTYKYNLQGSTQKLADARDMVLTQRNFNSYEQDPAAATRAFRLRRSYTRTVNQMNNANDCYGKFNTAWNNLGEIVSNLINPLDKVSAIRGDNGTAGESRSALAQVLRETADSIVHSMNAKLGDQFVFAGVDGMNVPFEWSEDGTQLFYRGVNVNAGGVEPPVADAPSWIADERALNGATWTDNDWAWHDYYNHITDEKPEGAEPGWMPAAGATAKEEEWLDYYRHKTDEKPIAKEPGWTAKVPDADGNDVLDPKYFDTYGTPKVNEILQGFYNGAKLEDIPETDQQWLAYYKDQSDVTKLKAMSNEERYIDLGMGANENAPNDPILGSYFNDALVGINFLGYGIDESDGFGDSGNYAVMLKELADVFDTWDEDTQSYNPELAKDSAAGLTSAELEAKAFRMLDKLKAGQETFTEHYVEMDARSKFIQTTADRLTTQKTNINEQILDIEQVDMADAITAFSWDYYCYSAALKIGNQLLSQSLIDYMN